MEAEIDQKNDKISAKKQRLEDILKQLSSTEKQIQNTEKKIKFEEKRLSEKTDMVDYLRMTTSKNQLLESNDFSNTYKQSTIRLSRQQDTNMHQSEDIWTKEESIVIVGDIGAIGIDQDYVGSMIKQK